jgi:cysteinyl-tRNA synthetase
MQNFVKDISAYARGITPDFIIIPQNGPELAFNNAEPDEEINSGYINAIDGIGIEELFYNKTLKVDNYRLGMLRKLKYSVKIIVSDFVSNNANLSDAVQRSKNEGFIAFPRSADNYHYKKIPANITDENTDDIEKLTDARNYLYLISTDGFSNKQAMIGKIAETNYDAVLIDLFFNEAALAPADIQQLKIKANGAKRLVIAYISIGSAENYRYYWKPGWKKGNPAWLKKKYEGYHDELWVEFWNPEWQKIIFGNDGSYIKKIIDAGFDGAYLDNVEAFYFLVK